MCLDADQVSQRIFRLSVKFILIFPKSYMHLLEGSRILSKRSKYFIWLYRVFYQLKISAREESGSDRIMPLTHPHLYFSVGCGAERILHECGYGCGFFRCQIWCGVRSVSERMRINIVR
jgi:hypothetical protein